MNKLKELWVKLKGIKNFEIILALVIIAIVVIIYSIVSSVGAKEVTEETGLEERLEEILSEIDGAGAIRGLDTSREAMSDAYRAVRVGLTGEDSVAAALAAKSDLPGRELIFAIEVFVELGLLRFDRGRLAAVRGKKSDLGRSALYTAVCRWKEKK